MTGTYLVHSEFDDFSGLTTYDDQYDSRREALAQYEAAIDKGAVVVLFFAPGFAYPTLGYDNTQDD